MTDSIPRKLNGALKPCLTLQPETKTSVEDTDLVQFTLKVKAGSEPTATTYKKKVARFVSGSPLSWIEVLESLQEIWTQNTLTEAIDREACVKTILRDDALTAFESSIEESQTAGPDPEEILELTTEMVTLALEAVSREVFPHRALVMQKLWMRRAIKKPKEMPIRKMASALTKMNRLLTRFPGATAADLFDAEELLEILEWSLPLKWRAKFDLAGYIPSLFDRSRLIAECEAIERSEESVPTTTLMTKSSRGQKKGNKSFPPKLSVKSPDNKYHCTEHGHNATHATADCYTLKNRTNQNSQSSGRPAKGQFSNNKFRKEINVMCKGKSRMKVIDQYSAVLKKERAKAKRSASKQKKTKHSRKAASSSDDSSSENDSDHSLNIIEPMIADKRETMQAAYDKAVAKHNHKKVNKVKHVRVFFPKGNKVQSILKKHRTTKQILEIEDNNETEEEEAFQTRIANLGQPNEAESMSIEDKE
jgi:hypothetical protein